MPPDARSAAREVRELRGEIRHWRRSRANASLGQAISDAYIGVLAFVMLGSMLVNTLIGVAGLSEEHCTSQGCRDARGLLPWVVAGATLVVLWALARTFGPVYAAPSVAYWLMETPLDRGVLLRGRLRLLVAAFALAAAAVAAGAALLAGFGAGSTVAFALLVAGAAASGIALAVLGQSSTRNPVLVLAGLALAGTWGSLLALTLHRAPELERPQSAPAWWWLLGGVLTALAVVAGLAARRLTRRLRRRDIVRGGTLVPGLGGALANLDLALTYDVLLAYRWRSRGSARSRRGGPSGAAALIWTDLIRIARSPVWLVLLAAAVVVPYAAQTAGAERVVVIVVAGCGFLAGLPFLSALRVLTRTAGVARQFPTSLGATRGAALAVPAILLGCFGLACVPAVHRAVDVPWSTALLLALAAAAGGLASGVRWVTGRPPDYGRPLITSPAGAVPTNLYGSALRGFDILLLTTAPMLLAPSDGGAAGSLVISAIVLAYLANRK
ncbi:DUF6297 domain-containing protein [Nocardioides dubius]|uniref:ABC transporter permease n=1 Tax=Nocardioides dubius TaxID=317019 RepID=A0ABN1TPZ4_9ACTN